MASKIQHLTASLPQITTKLPASTPLSKTIMPLAARLNRYAEDID